MRKLGFIAVGGLVLLPLACTQNTKVEPREAIVGTWEDSKDASLLEFTNGGEFKYTPADPKNDPGRSKSAALSGKYRFSDDKSVEFVVSRGPGGTGQVSVPSWMNMTFGSMAKILEGSSVTTTVHVTVAKDKLTLKGGTADPGEFKRRG
jgi:hypothetical protein